MTGSPIELFWTAKNENAQTNDQEDVGHVQGGTMSKGPFGRAWTGRKCRKYILGTDDIIVLAHFNQMKTAQCFTWLEGFGSLPSNQVWMDSKTEMKIKETGLYAVVTCFRCFRCVQGIFC